MKQFLRKFRNPKYLLKIFLLSILYFLFAKLGLSLAGDIKQVSLVWPATAIALFSLLVYGQDSWPAITIGALIANITTHETFPVALAISIGNTLEAVFAAYFLIKSKFDKSLDHVRDVLLFLFFSTFASTAISASVGTTSLILGGIGSWKSYWIVWSHWWIGDAIGSVVLTPYLLVRSNLKKYFSGYSLKNFLETVVLTGVLTVLCLFLFTPVFGTMFYEFPFEYAIFPILILTSFRFKQLGSTWKVLLISVISIWGTTKGCGQFAMCGNYGVSLLYLRIFVGIVAITFLIFSALVEEREKDVEEVKDSERYFRSLIEKSWEAIVLVDKNAVIRYASPSVERILGYAPDDLIGKVGYNIVVQEDKESSEKIIKKVASRPGLTERLEIKLSTRTGKSLWVEALATNLLDDSAVRAIVINFRDISEHKKIDESRTEFVSMAAHELRGPLGSIRWYSESLESMKKPEISKISSYLSEIVSATVRMTTIVNLLLNVTKAEMGGIVSNPQSINLHNLVNDVVGDFRVEIQKKKQNLEFKPEGKSKMVYLDPALVRIIIENLLSNAIKYTEEKGKINLSAEVHNKDLEIQVGDTGLGIPKDEREKIFTKLFRASNVKRRVPDGTGLGLYLVKAVVDKLNGKINFESEVGKGTTFFVKIPISENGGK